MGGPERLPILKGFRVLELTRLLPGPYASLLLANLGLEVIKVEEPGKGDYLRTVPPLADGESVFFPSINYGKKSVALDLKTTAGQEIFFRLVEKADVLLEGFRPGTLARWGLDYEQLRKVNPDLIYCSLTGYGQEGPLSQKAGHDLNYIAVSGLLGMMGMRQGRPVIPPIPLADLVGGTMAALAIVTALLARQVGGGGRYIDVAMLDGLLSWLSWPLAQLQVGRSLRGAGSDILNGGVVCYNVYETKDGRHVALAALEEKFWQAFCRAVGHQELIPAQMTPARAGERIYDELRALFLTRTLREWEALAAEGDFCLTPVLTLGEVLEHPQIQAREIFLRIGGKEDGPPDYRVGLPIRFAQVSQHWSLSPRRFSSPRLGEHTTEILGGLGISSDEIRRLKEEGVVG